MTTRVRRALALVFIVGFLISAPLVVLYTAGYRINVHTGRLVQTGDLSVGSAPKGATALVDGTRQTGSTPGLYKDFLPGTHTITLQKTGYLPWQKSLPIYSRETTFITEAVLNADAPAHLVQSAAVTGIGISSSTGRVAYENVSDPTEDEIWSFDPSDGNVLLLARFPAHRTQVASLVWSPDGSALAIIMGQGASDPALLVSADGTQRTSFDQMQSAGWDAGSAATYLLRTSATAYARLTVDGTSTPFTPSADAVETIDNNLLVVQPSVNGEALARTNPTGPVSLIGYLPSGTYAFYPAPKGLVLLVDWQNNKVTVIDPNAATPILLTASATQWQWEPNGRRLLYTDGFELHVFDPDAQTDTTLTRVSDPITGIAWRPSLPAIVYAQRFQITSLELDPRDGHEDTSLTQGVALQNVWTDLDGKNLFFFGTVNGQMGLFERALVE